MICLLALGIGVWLGMCLGAIVVATQETNAVKNNLNKTQNKP